MKRRGFLTLIGTLPGLTWIAPDVLSGETEGKIAYSPPISQRSTTININFGQQHRFTEQQVKEIIEELNKEMRDGAKLIIVQ